MVYVGSTKRKPRKPKEKIQAVVLRKQGYSLKEISGTLHISKSTASLWLRGVIISSLAQKRLKTLGISGTLRGLGTIQARWKSIQKGIKNEAEIDTHQIFESISLDKGYYKLLCALIFWCEGGKRSPSEVRFINSDPKLVQTFLYLLRNGFDIKEQKLRALIHLHEYHNEIIQKKFWAQITQIPLKQFSKSYVKPHTGIRVRNNYPGCLSIGYSDGGRTLTVLKLLYTKFPEYLSSKQRRGVVPIG